ncbi:MAG: hypothetical protein GSR84_01175 [Desulfurococcales archaeon]|nr:hypothetical protein [Desulfurococcales archaeon]
MHDPYRPGGDGVLLGYEENLESYTTNTVAKALLYRAAREHEAKTLIAAGWLAAREGVRSSTMDS